MARGARVRDTGLAITPMACFKASVLGKSCGDGLENKAGLMLLRESHDARRELLGRLN